MVPALLCSPLVLPSAAFTGPRRAAGLTAPALTHSLVAAAAGAVGRAKAATPPHLARALAAAAEGGALLRCQTWLQVGEGWRGAARLPGLPRRMARPRR